MKSKDPVWTDDTIAPLLPQKCFADGFVFAIAASPDIPMPEIWMPWLMSYSTADNTINAEAADALADTLMHALRFHLDNMRKGQSLLPGFVYNEATQVTPELSQWLQGVLAAHGKLEAIWSQAWQQLQQTESLKPEEEDPSVRLTRCLKLFTTLANPALAQQQRNEEQARALSANWPSLLAHLPAMLNEYVVLAGELAGALPNQFETFSKTAPANDQ